MAEAVANMLLRRAITADDLDLQDGKSDDGAMEEDEKPNSTCFLQLAVETTPRSRA